MIWMVEDFVEEPDGVVYFDVCVSMFVTEMLGKVS